MLSHDQTVREFEFALQRLVAALGGASLGSALGIKQGYLNRMANPDDDGTHFRAKDLIPVMRRALSSGLPHELALAPLEVMARALGLAVYQVKPHPQPADVIQDLSITARYWGCLGEGAIKALDPHGEGGRRVTTHELQVVEESGYELISHTAGVVATLRALCLSAPIRA